MLIISDCDGCIVDFYTPFESWCKKNYPNEPEGAILNKKSYTLEEYESRAMLMDAFHASGNVASLPFFEGAVRTLVTLTNKKHNVQLVTALPKEFENDRFKNFHPFFNPKNIHCVGEDKKKQTILDMNPVFVIEDKPSLIKFFSANGLRVLYPVRHYNKDCEYGTPFEDWNEVFSAVENYVD